MIGFSIVICSYNPNDEIFLRLLNAIEKLNTSDVQFEIIIIDNNSSPSLVSREYVMHFLKKHKFALTIVEINPGLTSARIAGIKQAKYEWLVFFDDDNEPYFDYLQNTKLIINQFPFVGAWGPGKIHVEYQKNNVKKWFNKNKHYFQDLTIDSVIYEKKEDWCQFYPNGTGLVIRKNIADYYKKLIFNGDLSLTDRIGKTLASGGDTQLILCAIKLDYFVGISPEIRLNHLISKDKIKRIYLLKQIYMTSSCYIKAFNEMKFEGKQIKIIHDGNKKLIVILYQFCRRYLFRTTPNDFCMRLYQILGEVNARYFVSGLNSKPIILRIFEKFINV
jgi:glycosyltransferase involved in cell wall biosynthesis